MHIVEVGGQKTRLLDEGQGPAVVVLHGWGGRIESMSPVIRCLSARFRVIALDLPGFGEAPVPAGVWGTPDYAAYVRDVIGTTDVARAHFLGHSFGAKTSLYLAATHSDLVDKLVLAASSGLRTAPSLGVRAKRLVSRGARSVGRLGPVGRRARDMVYDRIASTDYKEAGALRPILVNVVNEDLTHLLGRIASPTLLLWGTSDDAAPLTLAQMMAKLIPDAGLVTFEGAGHFAYLEHPDRFCRVVRHFLGAPVQ